MSSSRSTLPAAWEVRSDSAKANASTIMGQLLAATNADMRFGVISYMDYPQEYIDYYGYWGYYGDEGDYPYRLDQALTGTDASVQAAIDAMQLGGGSDYPESYT